MGKSGLCTKERGNVPTVTAGKSRLHRLSLRIRNRYSSSSTCKPSRSCTRATKLDLRVLYSIPRSRLPLFWLGLALPHHTSLPTLAQPTPTSSRSNTNFHHERPRSVSCFCISRVSSMISLRYWRLGPATSTCFLRDGASPSPSPTPLSPPRFIQRHGDGHHGHETTAHARTGLLYKACDASDTAPPRYSTTATAYNDP